MGIGISRYACVSHRHEGRESGRGQGRNDHKDNTADAFKNTDPLDGDEEKSVDVAQPAGNVLRLGLDDSVDLSLGLVGVGGDGDAGCRLELFLKGIGRRESHVPTGIF